MAGCDAVEPEHRALDVRARGVGGRICLHDVHEALESELLCVGDVQEGERPDRVGVDAADFERGLGDREASGIGADGMAQDDAVADLNSEVVGGLARQQDLGAAVPTRCRALLDGGAPHRVVEIDELEQEVETGW